MGSVRVRFRVQHGLTVAHRDEDDGEFVFCCCTRHLSQVVGKRLKARDIVVADVEITEVNGPEADPLDMQYVHCSVCGKRCSQYVTVQGEPAPLLVRAYVQCPECIEADGIVEGNSDQPRVVHGASPRRLPDREDGQ